MAWIEPVTDRTEGDVRLGTAKGYCNASDLNRIEGDCAILGHALGIALTTKTWQRTDFPTVSELARIGGNIQLLRDVYSVQFPIPQPPIQPYNHWAKYNTIEQILDELYRMWQRECNAVLYCGEGYAGQEIGVI